MLALYLAALIFGGIFLGFSMFSGSDSESSDFSHDTDLSHDTGDLGHSDIPSHGLMTEAAQFFSIRNIIFFLTFFGLTGSVLHWLNTNSIVTFLSSMTMGVFSAGFGYAFMKYIKNSDSGESISIQSLTGRVGKVVLPTTKNKRGKVLISSSSGTIELTALVSETSDEDELKIGETILVIDFSGNDAIITKSDL
ncbi:MAG: hypothetical protein CVV22_07795 [Ignavibacteriae bacterium HGW-Ignavibacteriae-1]|jgi:membrane protein implicated in regulation of membrane protease activity|nr:MAG: hypothetical protein CVV22_07795 [Ignavibacteriae bacterium HGW-Ignavibacteriae-1]